MMSEADQRMRRLGGCQCGAVRYAIDAAPLALYICHCRECRKQSASAFGMSLEVPLTGLRVTQGEPTSWSRDTDSGNRLRGFFCPRCGSRLWHQQEPPTATVTIKAGSLDAPVDATGAVHIWTSRKLPGITIPADTRTFKEEP
jgi:hypothetical protein